MHKGKIGGKQVRIIFQFKGETKELALYNEKLIFFYAVEHWKFFLSFSFYFFCLSILGSVYISQFVCMNGVAIYIFINKFLVDLLFGVSENMRYSPSSETHWWMYKN
jgi:hypothetical protein